MERRISIRDGTNALKAGVSEGLAEHVVHRDFETRSRAILKVVGAHRYAADPGTEVICAAFALDQGPVQLWLPGDPVPPEFVEAARNPSWIVAAHNDAFETAIERYILAPRFGWPIARAARLHSGHGAGGRIAGAARQGRGCAGAHQSERCNR
jgi:hypothetical protein